MEKYIYGLVNNCNHKTKSLSEAYDLIKKVPIVKISNVPIKSVLTLNGSLFANIITNFRTDANIGIGYVETKQGEVIIPPWWPLNHSIYKKYGQPFRKNTTIMVDAFIVNTEIFNYISKITELPNWSAL
jgi:hypothetical protein